MKHKLKTRLLLLAIICTSHVAYNQVQIGNDIVEENRSFFSIDLSSDGSILAIGRHAGDSIVGKSSVYKFDNNDWHLLGKPIEYEKNVISSECSVNLSASGNRLITGIPYYTGPDSLRRGLVRVYEFLDDDWTQIGQDLSGSLDGNFGIKVLISEDGNRIVVLERVYRDSNSTVPQGRIQVFDLVDDEWIQVGSDILSSEIVWDVAFSTDGNQLVFYGNVTMLFYNLSNTNEWEEQATFLDPKGSARGMSFSNDGNSLISFDYSNSRKELQVYSNENGWAPKGSRIAIDSISHSQAVFLNSDGSKIAMTAYKSVRDTIDNTVSSVNNYCFIYEYINNDWEQQFLFNTTGNEIAFSNSISCSDNGIIAIGYNELNGLVKVFDLSDFISSNSYITEEESSLYPNPTDGILHMQQDSDANEVIIYDPSGRLIRSQLIKNGEIDISDLNSGTYILQVGTSIQRVIKE